MNITPNADKILLEVIPVEDKLKGVILPEKYAPKIVKPKGRVVKVGTGKYSPNGTHIPCYSQIGDIAVYNLTAKAVELEEGNKKYVLLPEADVLMWEGDRRVYAEISQPDLQAATEQYEFLQKKD